MFESNETFKKFGITSMKYDRNKIQTVQVKIINYVLFRCFLHEF